MCGRFTLRSSPIAIARQLEIPVESLPEIAPRYNIAPTQPVLVFRTGVTGQRKAVMMRWGYPSSAGGLLINVRAETVANKLRTARQGFASRRCLIAADGFFEWQLDGSRKHPFFVRRRRDDSPLVFAGIWRVDPAQATPECVIITQAAGKAVRPMHSRRPVRLEPETWDIWLSNAPIDPATITRLLAVPAIDDWVAVPVSSYVNKAADDNPRCIVPVDADLHRRSS